MKNVPKKIYLNLGVDMDSNIDFNDLRGVTWSIERANNNDVEYYLKEKTNIKKTYQITFKTNRRKNFFKHETINRLIVDLTNGQLDAFINCMKNPFLKEVLILAGVKILQIELYKKYDESNN